MKEPQTNPELALINYLLLKYPIDCERFPGMLFFNIIDNSHLVLLAEMARPLKLLLLRLKNHTDIMKVPPKIMVPTNNRE